MASMIASRSRDDVLTCCRYSSCFGASSPAMPSASASEKPMMLVSGVLQLVGDVGEEIGLEPVGGDQRLVALAQRLLDAGAGGDVDKGQESVAIRQRHCGIVEDHAVIAGEPPLQRAPAAVERGGDDLDLVPDPLVGMELPAMRDHLAYMRLLGERRLGKPPDPREGGIEQLELAIGAEQRHPFMQIVDGLPAGRR